jgi:hypothetical protein
MSQFHQHTFAPSEMTKEQSRSLREGTKVTRRKDLYRAKVSSVPIKDPNRKYSGRFGVKDDEGNDDGNNKNRRYDNWDLGWNNPTDMGNEDEGETKMTDVATVEPLVKPQVKVKTEFTNGPTGIIHNADTVSDKHRQELAELMDLQQKQVTKLEQDLKTAHTIAIQKLKDEHVVQVTKLRNKFMSEKNKHRDELLEVHKQQMSELTGEYDEKIQSLKEKQRIELQEFDNKWQ